MKFLLTPAQWILADLDPIEWRFLDTLPRIASGEGLSTEARRRMFPNPLEGPVEGRVNADALLEDWDEYVRPDIASQFSSARDQVSRDLALALVREAEWDSGASGKDENGAREQERAAGASPEGGADDDPFWDGPEAGADPLPSRVVVDRSAAEAWYSTLNQARLLLNEAHDLAESVERFRWSEAGTGSSGPIDASRLFLLAQYDFYTALQSILIETILRMPGQYGTE